VDLGKSVELASSDLFLKCTLEHPHLTADISTRLMDDRNAVAEVSARNFPASLSSDVCHDTMPSLILHEAELLGTAGATSFLCLDVFRPDRCARKGPATRIGVADTAAET